MPVPPLPLEIVALIVDELASSFQDNSGDVDNASTIARRATGRNVALAARGWRLLGSNVVWRDVVLNSSEDALSLLGHLERHPHLCKAVKQVLLTEPEDVNEDALPVPAEAGAEVERIWSSCERIEHLRVATPSWLSSESLFHHLHLLTRLRHLDFTPDPSVRLYEALPAFLPSLESLANLRTLAVGLSTSTTMPSPSHRLPIRTLEIINPLLGLQQDERHTLQVYLVNLVQLDTLQTCTIHLYSNDLPILPLLFAFTSLTDLLLVVEDPTNSLPLIESLISHLQTNTSLRKLALRGRTSRRHPQAASVELKTSTIDASLRDLLRAIPSTLRYVSLDGFWVHMDCILPVGNVWGGRIARTVLSTEFLPPGATEPEKGMFAVFHDDEETGWHAC